MDSCNFRNWVDLMNPKVMLKVYDHIHFNVFIQQQIGAN